MAQNVIQRYSTEEDFHNNVRNVLSIWHNTTFEIEKLDNFLGTATPGDYPTSPLTDLGELRTLLSNLVASTEYIAFKEKVLEFIRI